MERFHIFDSTGCPPSGTSLGKKTCADRRLNWISWKAVGPASNGIIIIMYDNVCICRWTVGMSKTPHWLKWNKMGIFLKHSHFSYSRLMAILNVYIYMYIYSILQYIILRIHISAISCYLSTWIITATMTTMPSRCPQTSSVSILPGDPGAVTARWTRDFLHQMLKPGS